jgi:hypothetical protein
MGRCIWLHPFRLEDEDDDDENDWKRLPRPYPITITETQPPIPLVSFAAFCSNSLRCLLLSIDRSGSSVAAISTPVGGTPTWAAAFGCTHLELEDEDDDDDENDWKRLPKVPPNNHYGIPTPNPLGFLCCLPFKFSSLPSVQLGTYFWIFPEPQS